MEVAKKTKKKRGKEEPHIDFTKALENEKANVFTSPKNLKSLLLPANKGSCNNKLPEDCHYQPESLVKLFLLPDILVMLTFMKIILDMGLGSVVITVDLFAVSGSEKKKTAW